VACYLGMDIQIRRGCSYAVIDAHGLLQASGWLENPVHQAPTLVRQWLPHGLQAVGLDAPRQPLPGPRHWYWQRNSGQWIPRTTQKGWGRHCEVVISAHGLGRPQWTPVRGQAPEWMERGFALFEVLGHLVATEEVFPSAAYLQLQDNRDVSLWIDFSACAPGPKDMLDAWVAAAVLREWAEGRGEAVGNGDGLGRIILPRPLAPPVVTGVLHWPAAGGV